LTAEILLFKNKVFFGSFIPCQGWWRLRMSKDNSNRMLKTLYWFFIIRLRHCIQFVHFPLPTIYTWTLHTKFNFKKETSIFISTSILWPIENKIIVKRQQNLERWTGQNQIWGLKTGFLVLTNRFLRYLRGGTGNTSHAHVLLVYKQKRIIKHFTPRINWTFFDVDARRLTVVKFGVVRNFAASWTKPKSDVLHLFRFKLFFNSVLNHEKLHVISFLK